MFYGFAHCQHERPLKSASDLCVWRASVGRRRKMHSAHIFYVGRRFYTVPHKHSVQRLQNRPAAQTMKKVKEEEGTSGVKEELEEEKGDTSEPAESKKAKTDEDVGGLHNHGYKGCRKPFPSKQG